jgi:hypothetical protein
LESIVKFFSVIGGCAARTEGILPYVARKMAVTIIERRFNDMVEPPSGLPRAA